MNTFCTGCPILISQAEKFDEKVIFMKNDLNKSCRIQGGHLMMTLVLTLS